MKNYFGVFCIASSFSLLLVSHFATLARNDLVVSPQKIDLGEISLDCQVPFQFTIKNEGNAAFGFEIHKSCGCQALTSEEGVIVQGDSLVVGGMLDPYSQKKNMRHRMPLILEYWDMNNKKVRFGKRFIVEFVVIK